MIIASPIEPQPEFPKVDLTPKNADVLSVMLQNRAMVHEGHRAAESQARIYKIGHQAFRTAIDRIHDSRETKAAFDSGMTLYEAISSFVAQPPEADEEVWLEMNAFSIANQATVRNFDSYAEEALETFVYATPLTAEVVAESARAYGNASMARLAVVGASMARRFELEHKTFN